MDIYGFDGFNDYYGNDPSFGEAMTAVFAVIGIILLIVGILSLLFWILRSIGLMTIAKNRGLNNPWIAWIPMVGVYTLGAIADDIQEKEGGHTIYRWLLLGGNIVSWLLSGTAGIAGIGEMIRMFQDHYYDYPTDRFGTLIASNIFSSIGGLISLGVFIITILCLYYLYKCYKPQSATAYTVLSVIFPFLQSIFPFAIRNNQPNWIKQPAYGPGGYAPSAGEPWQQGGYYPYGGYNPQGGHQPPYPRNEYPPQPGRQDQHPPYGDYNNPQIPPQDDNNDYQPQ